MGIRLLEIDFPDFGPAPSTVEVAGLELMARLLQTRTRMQERGLSHLLIYGDREHFGNLWWLSNFDPRFEEALLILGLDAPPLILVGNECMAYLAISPLVTSGEMRKECFPPFSLLNQPGGASRDLAEILRSEGVGLNTRVGCAGWKIYGADAAIDLPGYVVDAARDAAGRHNVENATDIFVHPGYGLRARCGATEIAFFERSNWKASEALKRVLSGLRVGKSDSECLEAARYDGTPLSCHMTCKTGPHRISLASPRGDIVERGFPWSANIGYRGSNICRAGWVAESEADLPPQAQGYLEEFAVPYFQAMAKWFELMRIGTLGGEIEASIQHMLPYGEFGIFLNPGHLIHGEEWLSSPIYAGSTIPIASGMMMQSDVIPSSKRFYSTRMEDGYAIADEDLRAAIRARFPDCFARCMARRDFMANTLGITLPVEVLPLSNLCGMVMPFVLAPNRILAADRQEG